MNCSITNLAQICVLFFGKNMAAKNMENLTDSTHHQITHSFPIVRKGMYLFLTFVSVHVIGIIFIVINCLYLRCTRGHGSVRMNEDDFDRNDRKRCCKIRGAVACNVLLITHMFLTMTEGIMVLVYQSPSLYSYKLNTLIGLCLVSIMEF